MNNLLKLLKRALIRLQRLLNQFLLKEFRVLLNQNLVLLLFSHYLNCLTDIRQQVLFILDLPFSMFAMGGGWSFLCILRHLRRRNFIKR